MNNVPELDYFYFPIHLAHLRHEMEAVHQHSRDVEADIRRITMRLDQLQRMISKEEGRRVDGWTGRRVDG